MPAETILVDRPLSTAAVLRGGLRTLAKRLHGAPTLPDVELLRPSVSINAGHLDAYRVLCGFDRDHGIPITYPHLLAFPLHLQLMLRRDFPFPLAGLVHIANRIVQYRALRPDDQPSVRARFGPLRAHARGQALAIRAEVAVADETVWESESLYLRIGTRDPVGAPFAAMAVEKAARTQLARENLPAQLGPRYARISGDRNPIHISSIGARLFGFKRRIAHGMWTKARALALALPPRRLEAVTATVDFRAPILLPGTATFFADPEPHGARFSVRDAAGERLHLIGNYDADPSEKPPC